MQPRRDVVTYPDEFSAPLRSGFFARPPLRSSYFITGVLMLILDFAVVALVVVRDWNKLPTVVFMWMGIATAMVIVWWWAIYQIWQRLYEMYSQENVDASFARSSLARVFGFSQALISATLFLALPAWLIFLLALGGLSLH